MDEVQLADQTFDTLRAADSGAGVYLRARALASVRAMNGHLASDELQRVRHALEFLEGHEELASSDVRCLNLRFDLWWMLKSGQRRFGNEHYCLPFDTAKWFRVANMIKGLERLHVTFRDVQLRFLRALAAFHLGEFAAAFDLFDELGRRSEEVRGRRRIARTYLASTPTGLPIIYRGRVSSIGRDEQLGQVFVENLRNAVLFNPSEFGTHTLQLGDNLGDFHVAFSFLGIIAEPGDLRPRPAAR